MFLENRNWLKTYLINSLEKAIQMINIKGKEESLVENSHNFFCQFISLFQFPVARFVS